MEIFSVVMGFICPCLWRLFLAFLSPCANEILGPLRLIGRQEYSARTLGATWGIISAVMVPIVILLICVGWRIFQRRKQEEKEENDYMNNVKTRSIDPDESYKLNSDDESIPYKKDTAENSPEPTETVTRVGNDEPEQEQEQPNFYGQPYQQPSQQDQNRQWAGETEIN